MVKLLYIIIYIVGIGKIFTTSQMPQPLFLSEFAPLYWFQ